MDLQGKLQGQGSPLRDRHPLRAKARSAMSGKALGLAGGRHQGAVIRHVVLV